MGKTKRAQKQKVGRTGRERERERERLVLMIARKPFREMHSLFK